MRLLQDLTTCWLIFGAVMLSASFGQETSKPSPNDASYPVAPKAETNWRYKFYQGRWWYWLPSNSWAYHDGQKWVAYPARMEAGYRGPDAVAPTGGGAFLPNRNYAGLSNTGRWPNISNGSGVDAAPQPGGAPYSPGSLPPRGKWPRSDNGSGVNAAPQPGGSAARRGSPPPRGRWPRSDNGSGVDAAPEPGGAAFIKDR